jgi:hypothetical protein
MALLFSMTTHARSMTQIPSTQTKKTQEEEIFLEGPFEENAEEKPFHTASFTPLLNRR